MIGEDDYAELRRKEREILVQAMRGIQVRRLGSNTFSWAEDIAALLRSPGTAATSRQPSATAGPAPVSAGPAPVSGPAVLPTPA